MPDAPPDYYNRLLEQRRAEYASKGLSKIPPDFFSATTQYLSSLRDLLDKEVREGPTSKKVEMTRAIYQRALASARDVLESRLTKIAHQAAQHANLGGEPANLAAEERALYDALSRELSVFRRTATPFLEAPVVAGTAPAPAAVASAPAPLPSTVPTATSSAPPLAVKADPIAQGSAPPVATGPGTVVRVLKDLGSIALGRETLDLRKEDLLVLPQEKALLLVHGQNAEKVDIRPPTTTT